MELHGSSFNYTIDKENINKAFFLPVNQENDIYFVIGFKRALVQGKTDYYYFLIQFKTTQEVSLKLTENNSVLNNYKYNPN